MNESLFSSASVEWATPWELFRQLDAELVPLQPRSVQHTREREMRGSLYQGGGRPLAGLGGQKGILQSAIREGASEVDQESA